MKQYLIDEDARVNVMDTLVYLKVYIGNMPNELHPGFARRKILDALECLKSDEGVHEVDTDDIVSENKRLMKEVVRMGG